MAILGVGGRLRLKREAPEPTVLRPGNVHVGSRSIYMRNPAFWSGDQITLSCANGLPLDTSTNGPDCPDGFSMFFGGDWTLGSNRSHVTSDTGNFYSATNTIQFYMRPEECGLTQTATYFIYRDQLDRISFYTTRSAALNGQTANRIPLFRVDFNALIVSATGTAEYESAIATCSTDIGDYYFSDSQDEVTLASICDFAPDYTSPPAWITEYDNADLTPRYYINAGVTGALWMIQADLQSWSLTLNAPEVDTTAVGEKFGDAVKSIVNGGGSLDFLVDRKEFTTGSDSTGLMQLLLLTEKGCKAEAEFWMLVNRPTNQGTLLPGDLYYTAEILVTSSAINVRPDEIIAGSADFVTVGEIALRMGPN
jgi:hypothetical protein